jgi:peptidoglycan hydrolase CwlO-like protein
MEPENKKEIMIGWWKFAGLQAVSVLLIAGIFFAAKMFPAEVKRDYRQKVNAWKKVKEEYKQAQYQMEQIDLLLKKYNDNGSLTDTEKDQLQKLVMGIEQRFTAAADKKPYHTMPNLYQGLVMKYYTRSESLKSAGGCPMELEAKKKEIKDLEKDIDDKKDEIDELKDKIRNCKMACPTC